MLREILLKTRLYRAAKIANGVYRTWIRRDASAYDPSSWWDRSFYTQGVSDAKTISSQHGGALAAYHYASVELLILRHLVNHGIDVRGASVFDVGTGAGHWIDFYLGLAAGSCLGVDVSERAVEHLCGVYRDESRVEVHCGLFQDVLAASDARYDVINAIGVLFHVVDDDDWDRGLAVIADRLQPGGHLVVGGHFGILDNLDVQFDEHNRSNKRLRSARHWKRKLRALGFDEIAIHRNRAFLFVEQPMPESNLLVARKGRVTGVS
jgi:SAM-dependent methyltransferase